MFNGNQSSNPYLPGSLLIYQRVKVQEPPDSRCWFRDQGAKTTHRISRSTSDPIRSGFQAQWTSKIFRSSRHVVVCAAAGLQDFRNFRCRSDADPAQQETEKTLQNINPEAVHSISTNREFSISHRIHVCYMVTFTINIPQMLRSIYTSTMDPMGMDVSAFSAPRIHDIFTEDLGGCCIRRPSFLTKVFSG